MVHAAPGIGEVFIRSDLCPSCRQMLNERLLKCDGDWYRMLEAVNVCRLILGKQDRIGVGTFQPKDEKNQNLTGPTEDADCRRIAEFGSDGNPRDFKSDGKTNIANRGLVEFSEVLKLDVVQEEYEGSVKNEVRRAIAPNST